MRYRELRDWDFTQHDGIQYSVQFSRPNRYYDQWTALTDGDFSDERSQGRAVYIRVINGEHFRCVVPAHGGANLSRPNFTYFVDPANPNSLRDEAETCSHQRSALARTCRAS